MEHHPVAAEIAAVVARRDPQRLSTALTETVRLRALLPGGPIEAHGRDERRRLLLRLVRRLRHRRSVVESAGEAVADRLLIHYRLHVDPGSATAGSAPRPRSARSSTGRLAVIDLLCSGFREIEINA